MVSMSGLVVPTENSILATKGKLREPRRANHSGCRSMVASWPRKRARCQLLGPERSLPRVSSAPIFPQHLYFSTYIKEGCVSGGPSFVAVVQSADLRNG